MVQASRSVPLVSIGAARPQENDGPERDEGDPDDIVQMDAVPSWEVEDDSVNTKRIEPDDCRAEEDGHHCKQPRQGAEQPMRFFRAKRGGLQLRTSAVPHDEEHNQQRHQNRPRGEEDGHGHLPSRQ